MPYGTTSCVLLGRVGSLALRVARGLVWFGDAQRVVEP